MAPSLLTQFLRCPKTAHESCIRLTDSMKAVVAWHGDAERSQQKFSARLTGER